MRTLLQISASPRGVASESLAIADTFLQTYRDSHPTDTVQTWDLWDGSLPSSARRPPRRRWPSSRALIRPATRRVPGPTRAGPSNGSPPPIVTCSASRCGMPACPTSSSSSSMSSANRAWCSVRSLAAGYTGLLTGKKAAVIYTSAVYGPGRGPSFGADFQSTFFDDWLNWAGICDITCVQFRPNLATADAESGRHAAHSQARDAAKTF